MSNDFVTVQISVDNVGITRQGFGMPLVVSHNASFPDRVRFYATASDLAEDFATDSPEYLTASAFFAQSPKPPLIAVGRADGAVPTMSYTIEASSPANARAYSIVVKGEGVTDTTATYTSDSGATIAEIHAGLVSALNAVVGKNYTAAFAPLVNPDAHFVGEADTDLLTMAEALVYVDHTFTAASSDIVTIAGHGLLTGDGPLRLTTDMADLPLNLLTATDYWVIKIDANTLYLATSVANALADTRVDIGDAGTGTHTISDTAETRRVAAHGLSTGDGPFQVSTASALPTGLVAATDYWIIRSGAYTFQLAASLVLALAGTAIALSTDGSGVQTIADTADTVRPADAFTVTGDAAGDWFSLALSAADIKTGRVSIAMDHDSPAGLADELDEILGEDSSWYQVHVLYPSSDYIVDVADWTELNERTFVFASGDTDIINVAVGGGTDVGALALADGYTATSGMYYPNPSKFGAARWMGRWLPTDPGQATAALKTLVGLPVVSLTATQKANLTARRMQTYIGQYGRGVMSEGMVFSTSYRFLDVRRDVDWLTDELRKMIFGLLAGSDKIPYTPAGIAKVEGGTRGSIELAVARGVLAEGTTSVTGPDIDDVEDADKADRVLRNVAFAGTLEGAIHTVIPVRGSVTF